MATPSQVEVPSAAKREEITDRLFGKETVRVIPEVPPEIERGQVVQGATIQLPQVVTDDKTGQVLVKPATPPQPKISLPLSQAQMEVGLNQKVTESFRWLAEWCQRLLKRAFLSSKKEE